MTLEGAKKPVDASLFANPIPVSSLLPSSIFQQKIPKSEVRSWSVTSELCQDHKDNLGIQRSDNSMAHHFSKQDGLEKWVGSLMLTKVMRR
jgi:hypothetical protein